MFDSIYYHFLWRIYSKLCKNMNSTFQGNNFLSMHVTLKCQTFSNLKYLINRIRENFIVVGVAKIRLIFRKSYYLNWNIYELQSKKHYNKYILGALQRVSTFFTSSFIRAKYLYASVIYSWLRAVSYILVILHTVDKIVKKSGWKLTKGREVFTCMIHTYEWKNVM